MGECDEKVEYSDKKEESDKKGANLAWKCENIIKLLLVVFLLLILCLAIAGAFEAHWMEIGRGLFITIIVCCCVSIVLGIVMVIIKHRGQKKVSNEKPPVVTNTACNSEKASVENGAWEPHRKVSLVEQSTFTVERKLNVEIDMNEKDDDRENWKIHYVASEEDTEKKDVGNEKKTEM
eukprot:GFUD01007889.1.p1 GENE.GFUD01007889.1~~GFUD01007889.1.p1  ORF type:complete len:178 (+),score=71.08 GFUD01007889.1:37-570(+)